MKLLSLLLLISLFACKAEEAAERPEKLCPNINDCALKGKNNIQINYALRSAMPQNFKVKINGDAVYDSCFASRYSSVDVEVNNSRKTISVFVPQYKLEEIKVDLLLTDRGAFCAQDFDIILTRDYPLESVRLRGGTTVLRANLRN